MNTDPLHDLESAVEDEALRELIFELSERITDGEEVDVERLAAEHPQFAPQLCELLPTMFAMAEFGAEEAREVEFSSNLGRSLETERNLGDFRLVQELGRGGMGVVYEAEQISLGRRIALKVLPFAALLDERRRARFQNEARCAAALKHPNIVAVHAVGVERGVYYYAMELVEGRSLAQIIQQQACGKAVPPPTSVDAAWETAPVAQASTLEVARPDERFCRIAEIGAQAASAMEHAHQQGIVHRDVKPSNVLVEPNGRVAIADFGLAQIAAGEGELTTTGDVLGTLRYMSPEQARGERFVDGRVDVYSLGATLYELLALRPAFEEEDRAALLRQVLEHEPTPPRQLDGQIPVDLETIVLKAMAKEPDERYATAQALGDDLRRFLEHQPVAARRASIFQRVRKWGRRHRRVLGAVAAALVAAGVLGGVLLWREQRETEIALQREIRQRAEAQANLRLAMDALEHLYGKFVGGQMGLRPDLKPLQQKLLADATDLYREIADRSRSQAATQAQAAEAFQSLAALHGKFGERAIADEAHQQSLAIRRSLLRQAPDDRERLGELADDCTMYGIFLGQGGEADRAEALFAEAIDLYDRALGPLEELNASNDDLQTQWSNLGFLLGARGEFERAESIYQQIVQLQRTQLRGQPNDAALRMDLAEHLRLLGRWRAALRELAAARTLLEGAAAEERQAIADSGDAADYRIMLAAINHELAGVLARLDDQEAVERIRKENEALSQGLARDYPGVAEFEAMQRADESPRGKLE